MNKYYFLLMGIYLSCGLVMAQENMSYQELDSLIWNNYSQITQLEYEGYCHFSSYQFDTKTWKYNEWREIYGYSNNSAYYATNPVDSIYLTDKVKILHYSPEKVNNNRNMTAIVTEYNNQFPPELSSSDLLQFFSFSKKTSFNFINTSVSYEKSSSGNELIILKGDIKQSKNVIYIDPKYNFAIVKEKAVFPQMIIECIYNKYELINGFYLPTEAMQYNYTSTGNLISYFKVELKKIGVNNFINYDLLRNKLQEGEILLDKRFGEGNGFNYKNSSTLTEDSIFIMAEEQNKQITKKMKNNISTDNSYWLYGGLLFFIGCIFLICRRLMRRK